ncbi:E3 ubiquitin-protein ligase TRIM39-like [Mixophyes fleayi]|uniref:E3 ubiquitin-protein ligase TRIM39-like n=1 Tax=Mixophyes fleayi TaxID=3061075 RepID=UPI003F4DC00B
MASAALRDELKCSICLNIYRDPVSLRCGHNFCWGCIERVLDTQEGSGEYTCPDCRKRSKERPVLQKNRTLCNIVETFPPNPSDDSEEGVKIFCLYCVDSPVQAVKTCLQCETSLCGTHLQAHNKASNHVLAEPTASLENRKCSIHKEPLQYYCCEDAACTCVSCCLVGDHRGHNIELIDEAVKKKKEKLEIVLQEHTVKRNQIENRSKKLKKCQEKVQKKSVTVQEKINNLFTYIIQQVRNLQNEIINSVNSQELDISNIIQHLETQNKELSRKIRDIEKLCNTTDPLSVLQDKESDGGDLCHSGKEYKPDRIFHRLLSVAADLDDVIIIKNVQQRLFNIVNEYIKREYHVPENALIPLNEDSAGNNLAVSECRRTIYWTEINQNRSENPESFNSCPQVISKCSYPSGRHIWKVETSGSGQWRVGAAYASIGRRGDTSPIGSNNKSWCLMRNKDRLTAVHDKKKTWLHPTSPLQMILLYLDYEAGRLSFYQLCDPIRHLHTFTASFTEPLHAAFYVSNDAWIKIID